MGCENNLEEQEEELQLKQWSNKTNMSPEQECYLRHFSVLLNIKAEKVEADSDLQYSVT